MYKFTNGLVVFDAATRDKYINAGYKLITTETKRLKKQLCGEDVINISDKEVEHENTIDSRIVSKKSKKCNKTTKRI